MDIPCPAHDEFFQVVVEVLLVKGRWIYRVKELFKLLQLDLDRVHTSSRTRNPGFRNGRRALASGHFISNGTLPCGGGKGSSRSMKSCLVSFNSNAPRFSRT
jgi:hypothetical protein